MASSFPFGFSFSFSSSAASSLSQSQGFPFNTSASSSPSLFASIGSSSASMPSSTPSFSFGTSGSSSFSSFSSTPLASFSSASHFSFGSSPNFSFGSSASTAAPTSLFSASQPAATKPFQFSPASSSSSASAAFSTPAPSFGSTAANAGSSSSVSAFLFGFCTAASTSSSTPAFGVPSSSASSPAFALPLTSSFAPPSASSASSESSPFTVTSSSPSSSFSFGGSPLFSSSKPFGISASASSVPAFSVSLASAASSSSSIFSQLTPSTVTGTSSLSSTGFSLGTLPSSSSSQSPFRLTNFSSSSTSASTVKPIFGSTTPSPSFSLATAAQDATPSLTTAASSSPAFSSSLNSIAASTGAASSAATKTFFALPASSSTPATVVSTIVTTSAAATSATTATTNAFPSTSTTSAAPTTATAFPGFSQSAASSAVSTAFPSFSVTNKALATAATSAASAPTFGVSGSTPAGTSDAATKFSFAGSSAPAQTSASSTPSSSGTLSYTVGATPKLPSEITGKTVEDIVKDWNSELQERTNKFRKQAAAIAEWDRRILQNRNVLIRLEAEVAKVAETQRYLENQLELIKTHQQEGTAEEEYLREDEEEDFSFGKLDKIYIVDSSKTTCLWKYTKKRALSFVQGVLSSALQEAHDIFSKVDELLTFLHMGLCKMSGVTPIVDMDEDSYSVEEICAASLAQKEKEEPATETASLQKSLMHPPGGKPARPPSLITATSVDNSSDFNFTPPSNSISESLPVLARPSPVYGNTVETKGHAGEKGSLVPLSTADSPVVDSSSKSASDGTETEYSDTAVLKMATLIQQRNSEPDKEVKPWKVEGTAMSSAFATSSPSGNSGFGTSSPPSSSNGLVNQGSASQAFFSSVVSVPPSEPQTTLSSHPTPISGSLGFQFGGGNSSPLAANLVPSSSKPQVTPIVSEKPLPVDNIGSPSVMIPAPSAPVSGTSFMATAASTQVDSSSLADSSSLGNQLTEAGAGSASFTGNPPSHLSSYTPSPTSGLPVASTFGAVSSPFGSSVVAAPVIGSSSSVTTIVSFDVDIQKTSAPSSVLVKPLGTECSSLFNSGFSSSFSGMGGLSFGASSSGATAATSTFSFGESVSGAASTTVGFSFGGSSTNLTASSASTGFSFTGLSSSSASSSPSTTGIFPCATASSTASSPSTGFSFGGSSVGASASSSSSPGFAFDGSSVGGTASSSTAGFSFGVSSVGANASSSSTTGFSFGLSAVGASGSSSNAGFSFGGSTAGASTLSPVTGFPVGGSSGSSTNSSAITSFSTGPSLAAVSSAATGFSFGLSSSASLPATIGFSFGAGTSSSATTAAFSFGTSSSLNNSPFLFGSSAGTSASTGSLFSFTPTSSTTGFTSKTGSTFPPQSMVMFGSASPTNDQMNFEDSMADDVFHASPPVTPAFAVSSTPSSNFKFGFPNVPTVGQPVFSFGAPQGLPSSQAPSPFAAGGSLEFAGGSFSLGTNGGDKSGRKIVRVKRDKVRKK